ncbi:MAG: SH3 domain-containing protein [Betaproteobacteria bacterium]|nr:SH3 domain-containing protein [Betaproteobacteria bacterium]
MALAAVASAVMAAGGVAQATADGPDQYRVHGVSPGRHLTLRAEPSTASAPLARIPANATCLRSLGCQGGLSFEEFATLSDEDKRRRAAEHPRWCKVDYRGTVGWVAGRYLAEDACPPPATP